MSRKFDADGVPLIVESYPTQYQGLPFVTYLQFHNSNSLVIVDNVRHKQIQCFVIDLCDPEGFDSVWLLEAAAAWYDEHSHRMPLSIFINQLTSTANIDRIYRTFNVEYITRIVGPLFTYPVDEVIVTRRKKRKSPPVQKSRTSVTESTV